MRARSLSLVVILAALGAPATASAQAGAFGDLGGFNSVLAVGQGTNTTGADLAANQALGTTPPSFTDQLAQYSGISRTIDGLTLARLDDGWKNSSFRTPGQDAGTTQTPRPGVTIVRDPVHFVPRVYGAARADTMWGAGYVTAQDRLFLMDVLRHTAKASTVELLGPSAAAADAEQITRQDISPAELQAQFDALPQTAGPEGALGRQDVIDYVAGINAFIDQARTDPTKLPAEYPALGITPERWEVTDSLATAVLLISQFTSNGGGELANAQLRQAFEKRFGAKDAPRQFALFRQRRDPKAVVITDKRFPRDEPGRTDPASVAMPDPGSVADRNPVVEGPGAGPAASSRQALPAWAKTLAAGLKLPRHASNALLVDGAHSKDGRPLAAMGPQVSYFTPEIFIEYELHGPGFDASGVAFPGAAPYVLIGHGKDFAWTGTTPNGDTVDTFAEKLCNPDGSAPSFASESYEYKGECRPFLARNQTMSTPVAPTSPEPSQTITLRALRSVHGTVFSYGRVGGASVAYTESHRTAGVEARSLIAFKQLGEGKATDGASFQRVMRNFTGEENWFYVGQKDIAWIRSGLVPRHAQGTDPDFPIMGTGQWDWDGDLPPEANPNALNPDTGFLASWNNKENPGDPAPPATWSFGPVHRQQMLVRKYRAELKLQGGKIDLAGMGRVSVRAATTDLRGQEIVAYLGRLMGTPADPATAQALETLKAWAKAGSQRRDKDGDALVDESRAVALMDAWWPLLVRRIFEPKLGDELIDEIVAKVNPLPERGTSTFFFDGWWGYVQKDLRTVLKRPVRAWPKTAYCGGGGLVFCRKLLTDSLGEVAARLGPDPKIAATCPETEPPSCDQIVPTTAGAVGIEPFPFHNRGTFHQLVEVGGPSGG